MKNLMMLMMAVVALGVVCGCSKSEEVKVDESRQVKGFDIPRTLYERMMDTYDEVRARDLNLGEPFDPYEMLGLAECGFASNVAEIVKRPRGVMVFVDDQCTGEERHELWPFDLDAFEAALTAKMRLGEQGYQLVGENGELLPRNPTLRWINSEVETWSIKQLDGKFRRMSPETYCTMLKVDKMPEGVIAWQIDELYYLCIEGSSEGAWNPRQYVFLIWDRKHSPVVIASFDSFPNAKEATAALCFHCDVASRHNLAVLEWQHRSNRYSIMPRRIEDHLKIAQKHEVPTASANLKVLYDHFPELRTKEGGVGQLK